MSMPKFMRAQSELSLLDAVGDRLSLRRRVRNYGFNGEAGFEELRKSTKQTADLFRDITNVLAERAELDLHYARTLEKLAARLVTASQTSTALIDNSWKMVADSFTKLASVYNSTGTCLRDEIVAPLKNTYDSQLRTRKFIEGIVYKTMKRLAEQRTEQLRLKEKQHTRMRDLESVEKVFDAEAMKGTKALNDKNMVKLAEKKRKLNESLIRTEKRYEEISTQAEKTRAELESAYHSASERLENVEQHRLSLQQTAIGSYKRRMQTMGSTITNALLDNWAQMERIADYSVQEDLRAIVVANRPESTAFKNVVLCDFYQEDPCVSINFARRRVALTRLLHMFERDFERARKDSEGLLYLQEVYGRGNNFEAGEDEKMVLNAKVNKSKYLLQFLDYHIFKLRTIMLQFERHGSVSLKAQLAKPPAHSLAKYEEKVKDKANLRATVLRIPLYDECSITANDWQDANHPEQNAHDTQSILNYGDCQQEPTPQPRRRAASMQPVMRQQQLTPVTSRPCELSSLPIDNSSTMSTGSEGTDNEHSSSAATPTPTNQCQRPASYTQATNENAILPPTMNNYKTSIEKTNGHLQSCVAMYDFSPGRSDEITLKKGDEIVIIKYLSPNWWKGSVVGTNRTGLFPSNYVRLKRDVQVI